MTGVVIVAGGRGVRMGAEVPKQFLLLGGKPILKCTVEAFQSAVSDAEIVVVVPQAELWRVEGWGVKSCAGGATRTESVRNGLRALSSGCDIIAVHDGVRPFVSRELIGRCMDAVREFGSAIPVVEVVDSVRMLLDGGSKPLERAQLRAVQTPQVFRAVELRRAYSMLGGEYTDDATIMEAAGYEVHLVEGESANKKITKPEDLG